MATKYSINVLDSETQNWIGIALFSDIVETPAIIDVCRCIWDCTTGADDLALIDLDTGEILWNAADAQEYDEPDDWDSEMGFDPYEGCYSYDC